MYFILLKLHLQIIVSMTNYVLTNKYCNSIKTYSSEFSPTYKNFIYEVLCKTLFVFCYIYLCRMNP